LCTKRTVSTGGRRFEKGPIGPAEEKAWLAFWWGSPETEAKGRKRLFEEREPNPRPNLDTIALGDWRGVRKNQKLFSLVREKVPTRKVHANNLKGGGKKVGVES